MSGRVRLNLREGVALARFSLVAGAAARWQIISGAVAGNLRADGKVVPVFADKSSHITLPYNTIDIEPNLFSGTMHKKERNYHALSVGYVYEIIC